MADCRILRLHTALHCVNGCLGKVQSWRCTKTRSIRLGNDPRRPTVHQSTWQHLYFSRVALGIFYTTLGGTNPIHHLDNFCFHARLTLHEFKIGQVIRDGR